MQRFDLGGVPPCDLRRRFRENVEAMCGWPLELTTSLVRLEARAVYGRLGDVTVGEIGGAPHGVAYPGGGLAFDSCLVVFPRRTRGHLAYGDRREALVVDRAYLLDHGAPWNLVEEARFHHLVLKVPRSALPSLRDGPLPMCSLRVDAASTTLVAMMKSLVELHVDLDELSADSRAVIGATLCSLLDAAISPARPLPEADVPGARERYHRHRIHDHALLNLGDPRLSVESIAAAVGLSTRHVHRLYADDAVPLMRWIWAERLDRCRAELLTAVPHRPISAVAYAWGFSDAAHFSRAFRQRFGISPRAVRATAGRSIR